MNEFLFGQTNWRVLRVILLAVGVFILVLAFIPIQSHQRHYSPIGRSKAQVRSLAQGVVVFSGNRDDLFPTAEEWPSALIKLGYIEPEQLVSRVENGDGVSYIYVPSSHKLFEGDFENRIVIYEDPKHFEEGVVVGFADAHVEVIEHEEFERMLAEQLASDPQGPDPETP